MTQNLKVPAADVVEVATIKLAPGKSATDLYEVSDRFQRNFLSKQAGFVRRELVRKSNGDHLDIIHWRSSADAEAVMRLAETDAEVQAFFAVMDFDPSDPGAGVEHCKSIAVHEMSAD